MILAVLHQAIHVMTHGDLDSPGWAACHPPLRPWGRYRGRSPPTCNNTQTPQWTWWNRESHRGHPFQYYVRPFPVQVHMYHHGKDIKIDGLVQERRNSSALAMELRLSCTNPSNGFIFRMEILHMPWLLVSVGHNQLQYQYLKLGSFVKPHHLKKLSWSWKPVFSVGLADLR